MTTMPYRTSLFARPLHWRVLDALADGWDAWRAAVHLRTERRRARRALQALQHLDAHALRDIGAPEWLVAAAAERQGRVETRLAAGRCEG
ncbi:MAG TPA: hypothetical protein VFZ93_14055 [Albitalea sp.]